MHSRKIINIIGGTFIIESSLDKGAKITVTLDQEIVDSNKGLIENKIDSYKNYYKDIKSIGVITENDKNVKVIKQIGKKNNYIVESFDMTKTCLDKVRDGEVFDAIVIDEDMDKINARSFLDKVRKVDSFKGKVFVITKKKKSYSTGKGSDSASIGTKVTNYLDKIIDICKENNINL